MSHLARLHEDWPRQPQASRLDICAKLLNLARDADNAGLKVTAEHLIHLANVVLEEPQFG
jgi:hypothetical protein